MVKAASKALPPASSSTPASWWLWLDEHRAGKRDNSRKIWTVYIFLVWYDIYFNGASHEPGDLPTVS